MLEKAPDGSLQPWEGREGRGEKRKNPLGLICCMRSLFDVGQDLEKKLFNLLREKFVLIWDKTRRKKPEVGVNASAAWAKKESGNDSML